MVGECGIFSISLLADYWINHTFAGPLDYSIQAVTNYLLLGPPRDATNLSHLHCEEVGDQELPDLSSSSLCQLQ